MEADNLDIRLLRYRSRRDEPAWALAGALLEAGRAQDALEVAHAGLSENEDDAELLVLEGRAWFEQGDLAQAQAALLRAAKTRPSDKEPYRWLAQVMMQRGEPQRAAQVLERAITLDPRDTGLHHALARAQRLARIARDAESGELPREPVAARLPVSVAPSPFSQPAAPKRGGTPFGLPRAARDDAPPRAHALDAPKVMPTFDFYTPTSLSAPPAMPEPEAIVVPAPIAPPAPVVPSVPARSVAPLPDLSGVPDLSPEQDEDEATRAYEVTEKLSSILEEERTAVGRGASHLPPRQPLATAPEPEAGSDDDATLVGSSLDILGEARRFAIDLPELEDEDELPATMPPKSDVVAPVGARARADEPEDEDFDEPEPSARFILDELSPKERTPSSFEPAGHDDALDTEPVLLEHPLGSSSAASNVPVHEPEPPEAVLSMLADQGIYERASATDQAEWVAKKDAPRPGHRLGKSLAVAWLLAMATAGGGYYGFTRWLDMRRADAKELIARAVKETAEGDHAQLVSAERGLIQARELDPKSQAAIEQLLFVHATRAIEDASGDLGLLRTSLARAERENAPKGLVLAAKALVMAYDGDGAQAKQRAEEALAAAGRDARVFYLVGRLQQRMGLPGAEALLEAATTKDPTLSLAYLGRAEIARQTGRHEDALSLLEKAKGADGTLLHAELWSLLLRVGTDDAAGQLQTLDGLAARVEGASPSDKLLALCTRAALLSQSGDIEGARAAVRSAASMSVQDPELMLVVANRAAAVGEHDLAYRAARKATSLAPLSRRYRDALADVLIRRGDGRAVLAALEGFEDDGAWMLTMRARAALLTGSREALEETKRTLSEYRRTDAGRDDMDAASLLLRSDLRLGANAESLIAAARSIARKAPDSPLAQIALGEILLEAGRGEGAVEALERAKKLGSEDADVSYLLGRGYRSVGKPEQAKASLEQALALAPSHTQARTALGGLLLDSGDYAGAERLFASLEKERAGASATLGLIEAELGRGDVAAAKQRFDALSEDERALPGAQVVLARIAVADGRGAEAAKLLEPLTAEDSEYRSAETLVLLGDALYASTMVDTAAGVYEQALELDPEHPDALIGRAMAALRAEKTKQVEELLTRAERSLTTRVRAPIVRARLLLTRAKAYVLDESFEKAAKALAEVIPVAGIPAEAYFWYGEALAKTKTPGAAEQYTKYLELEPRGEYAARARRALAPR